MSYAELAFSNLALIVLAFGLEKVWLLKHKASKTIVYEKIELIKPERYDELKADLEERTGLKINRIEHAYLFNVHKTMIFIPGMA